MSYEILPAEQRCLHSYSPNIWVYLEVEFTEVSNGKSVKGGEVMEKERENMREREREIIKYPGIIILRVESLRSGIRWITFSRFFHKSFRSTLENCIIRGLKKALDHDKNIQTSIIFIKKQAHKRISRKKIFI